MISIAMAAYNGEKYIREQLDSILAQTEQNFEVVICDDVSTDLTLSILKEYEKKDSRFCIYENEKNLGFRENFNKAVSLCKGDFIAFSDQDDIWLPHHLQILKENIGENFVCAGRAQRFFENDILLNLFQPTNYQAKNLNSQINRLIYQCYAFNIYQGASQMISKRAAETYFPIEKDEYAHDWASAANAIAENKFIYINEIITKWRKHLAQVTNMHDSREVRKNRLKEFVQYMLDNNKNLNEEIRDILEKALEFHSNRSIFYRLSNISHAIKISKIIYGSCIKQVLGYLFTASL
jgi:glycosyltransferase involved in cell wall biosynthesis